MLIHLRTLLPLIVGDCYPGFLFLGPKMALFSKERWGCFARRPSSDAVAPILTCDLMLGARGGTPRYDKKDDIQLVLFLLSVQPSNSALKIIRIGSPIDTIML